MRVPILRLNNELQQHLPLAVLKHWYCYLISWMDSVWLQQCLPFTVLKHFIALSQFRPRGVATVLTVHGIETLHRLLEFPIHNLSCNSAYRLRYWNFLWVCRNQRQMCLSCNSTYRLRYWNWQCCVEILPFVSWVATVLTVHAIETLPISYSQV